MEGSEGAVPSVGDVQDTKPEGSVVAGVATQPKPERHGIIDSLKSWLSNRGRKPESIVSPTTFAAPELPINRDSDTGLVSGVGTSPASSSSSAEQNSPVDEAATDAMETVTEQLGDSSKDANAQRIAQVGNPMPGVSAPTVPSSPPGEKAA